MRIVEFLRPDAVIADLAGQSTEEVLAELCRPLAQHGQDSQALLEILLERETLGSTGIGDGVAIPHGMFPGTSGLLASFGRSRMGVDFNAIDRKPVRYFFTLFVAKEAAGPHLQALARVSRVFKNPALREAIFDAKDAPAIYRLINEADAKD